MGMAEPRRVAFISLSPVRRREAEFPGTEREPEYPREPPRLEPQPYREPARTEPPAPREVAPRSDAQPPPREKPLPQREVSRAEPPMSLQREPPRPEPPPPPLPQLHLQPPPPRESTSRAEPQPRPPRETVRLELVLKDPTDESCVEFSYPELLLCGEQRVQKIPPSSPRPREPRDPSASPQWFAPSDAHLARLGSPQRVAGRGRGRAGVLFSAPLGWPRGSYPLHRPSSPTPRILLSLPLQTLFGSGFSLHLSKPQVSSVPSTKKTWGPCKLRCWVLLADLQQSVERKRKPGGHAPQCEAETLCNPSRIIFTFVAVCCCGR